MDDHMERARNFNPAWFASVMGTGAVAIASYKYSSYWSPLKEVGIALTYLNVVLYVALLIPWILRWILYRKDALEDLRHPSKGHFYGTSGAATIVLAAQFLAVLHNQTVAWYLWLWGLVLTFIFAFWMSYEVFIAGEVDLRHLSPAWYIPPVALVILPFGAAFMRTTKGYTQEFVTIVNYLGWGAGFFLYLVLYAVVTLRFIRHELMPPQMAPLIWMNLGPIGASITALFALVNNSSIATSKDPLFIFAFFLWGLGFWWLVMAVALTLHYIRNMSLPYSLAWWAFIFPLGAFTNATMDLGSVFELELMRLFGYCLLWLLLALWSVTFTKTLKMGLTSS
ncbi:C4-dicarboxylate transporter/malic acid transport protein (TehA/Mae1) [Thermococcus gammatolerans EJ3]|uniref:C4-dicarboxylate transporter/malic acid transport protein (TehA/Mae1) n=2 Tax=Thermococcus TaxID=2263 RepID=C5A538_THEGJ|nr:C4-dicarboxylate transporter/malic acid transport protein (TehA/Mae1) [Thermococcus gammatolerans EJ3]